MINVSIVDDEPEFIDFFRSVTLETSNVVCRRTALNIDDFLSSSLHSTKKHFLFLDIHLGTETSIERIPEILSKYPELEIVIYSVDEDSTHLMTALKLGACGYILKSFDKMYLKSFFDILEEGGAAISPVMARKLIVLINENAHNSRLKDFLNSKEIKILSFLADGWTYQYIANDMEISINTVRYYIKQIYKKLNVNNRGQAVKIYQNTA